jgi:hypothetical protein
MDEKVYKRIPVLPDVKKEFDVAYAESDCKTMNEFIYDLLIIKKIHLGKSDHHVIELPSGSLGIWEVDNRIWINWGEDIKKWVDITDMIPKKDVEQ